MELRVEVPDTEGEAIRKMFRDDHYRNVINAKATTIKLDKFSYLRRRLGKDVKVDTNEVPIELI